MTHGETPHGKAPHGPARPVLARGRLVTVDGHPVCAGCGHAVIPAPGGRWEHLARGRPFPRRSKWFAPVTWPVLRGLRTYREFTARYPWTVRPELCGGAVTTEDDWREGARRLREYHAALATIRRRLLSAGENPYLDLVRLLGGPGPRWNVPVGMGHVLNLPERRRELAALFAWAIPDEGALAVLGGYGPLLECGAGTGYWAALLRARGGDVIASDLDPRSRRRSWSAVQAADAVASVRAHRDRVLFLCWPPYDDDRASYTALRAYRGDVLVYAGGGPDGPTGTVRLHRELTLNWHPAEQAALPTWPGLRDRLVVYRRNPVRRGLTQRERCPACRRFVPTGSAGRCDRCFARNPPALAIRVSGHRVEYPREVVNAMPAGLRLAFERSPDRIPLAMADEAGAR